MTTQDEPFLQQLRATFAVEAQEHLQALSSMLLDLEGSPSPPGQPEVIEDLHRHVHSLKGASRAVDLSEVEGICQALEDMLASWKSGAVTPTVSACDTVHQALDVIGGLISSDSPTHDKTPEYLALIEHLRAVPQAGDISALIAPTATPIGMKKPALADTVRIAVSKLEAGLLEAEGMLVLKSAAALRVSELRSLTAVFSQWRKEWDGISDEVRTLRYNRARGSDRDRRQHPSSPQILQFLDRNLEHLRSLEDCISSLASQTEQDRHDLTRMVDGFLENSKRLLMLPFATLADFFPKVVRDLCRDQHKDAAFVLVGGEVEIDKRILEGIKDALTHVLRNCVDHGIETPTQRESSGKAARACISLTVRRTTSGMVEIVVADDGAGIDVGRIKNAAVAGGLITLEDSRTLPDNQALALVFHSGLSTRETVTEISGRGLGMAIVRADVERLGGRVTIDSQPGIGTTLRIILPLTIATTRGLFVTASDQTFVLPTNNVEHVFRVKPSDLQTVENREAILIDHQILPVVRLDDVLGLSCTSVQDATTPISLVIIRSVDRRIALVVSKILHEEEVLIKPFRRPLIRICNFAGATVTGSGKALPVLDVADLFISAQTASSQTPAACSETDRLAPRHTASVKRLLVVEDSITSRMLLKGMLEAAGYYVKTAPDGVEAFTSLRGEHFDLVVSDVEMPRLNGLGLTAKIRSDHRFADLPVILVTGLESPAQREQGIDAGADAYIVKSGFDQSQLLEAVGRLI
ncbi:MAG TPA: response regulator [Tepidisphaeraceae bacterium]|jgi:two-component system chemotaxis sensor kinase CheA|nr:response regulator [Tepidisphaeraceae bacterium]